MDSCPAPIVFYGCWGWDESIWLIGIDCFFQVWGVEVSGPSLVAECTKVTKTILDK